MVCDLRYDWGSNPKYVVFNNLLNNQWQNEERPAGFPFDSGYLTTVKIMPSSAKKAYEIYANGKHFYDFNYRTNGSPSSVNYLTVIMEGVPDPGIQVVQVLVSFILYAAILIMANPNICMLLHIILLHMQVN